VTLDRQHELLATWLRQEPGTEPPAELEPEVVEAIYALRPDLAPPPRVTIEQILAEVGEGPLAAAVDEASVQGLVSWLEAHPGQEPPAQLEVEVVEAVYALRPDLAPAPRVDLDDIFGAVRSGPFAAAATAATATAPVQAEPALPGSLPGSLPPDSLPDSLSAANLRPDGRPHGARELRPRGRRLPAWALPGLGALAVAATAVFFVVPRSEQALNAPSPFELGAPGARTAASSPAPSAAPASTADAPEASARPMLEQQASKLDATAANTAAAGPVGAPPSDKGLEALGYLSTPLAAGQPGASQDGTVGSRTVGSSGSSGFGSSRFGSSGFGSGGGGASPGGSVDRLDGDQATHGTEGSARQGRGDLALGNTTRGGELSRGEGLGGLGTLGGGASTGADDLRRDRAEKKAEAEADDAASRESPDYRPLQDSLLQEQGQAKAKDQKAAAGTDRPDAAEAAPAPSADAGPASRTNEEAKPRSRDNGDEEYAADEAAERRSPFRRPDVATATPAPTRGTGLLSGSRYKSEAANESAPAAPAAEPAVAERRTAAEAVADMAAATTGVVAPAGAAVTGTTTSTSGTTATGSDLSQLRAQAWPVGGLPDLSQGRPEVAAAWATADAAQARGDEAGYLAALRPLLSHTQADVALDAAYRMARRQQALGQLSAALGTIRAGLVRGGSRLQRGRLLALQGELYERQGLAEEAAQSYESAIESR